MRFIAPTLLLASFVTAVPQPHFRTPVAKRAPLDYDPAAVAKRLGIEDPFFAKQWALHSLNVPRVWEELGFTGKGVLVAVVDGAIMHTHMDLQNNFDHKHSFDFIERQEVPESPLERDLHGTACAGIIAAEKNTVCGVGIAYNSHVAGIRVLDEDSVVAKGEVEANALAHDSKRVDIYSCSYGVVHPTNLDGPLYDARLSLLKGVNYGRVVKEKRNKRALGNIYVFGAGNTGHLGDNCNYNSWATSIYTITIGAVGNTGEPASYSTPCTAVMAATYSGSFLDDNIFGLGASNTDSCENNFSGTSAATPAASGIFALALEANPRLAWRDVQHLIVQTAKSTEGYNEYTGFGVLDAYDFVLAAKTWQPVRQQRWIETHAYQFGGGVFSDDTAYDGTPLSKEGVWHAVEITQDRVNENSFDMLEHVQVKVWVRAERRGDIEVTLTSPSNVVSALGVRRPNDHSPDGLMGWTFMSVKHWGENPVGTWWLKINDQFDGHASYATGRLLGFNMMFWGSASDDEVGNLYTMPEVEDNTFPPLGGRHTISVGQVAQEIAPIHPGYEIGTIHSGYDGGPIHSGYGETWT